MALSKDQIFGIISMVFGAVPWFIPNADTKTKVITAGIVFLVIVILFFKEKLFVLRKYYTELITVLLLGASFIILRKYYPADIIPVYIAVLLSVSLSFLFVIKYGRTFIYRRKTFLRNVLFTEPWDLNHWQGNYASLHDDTMIFSGANEDHPEDGSNIDLLKELEIGVTYEISCLARSLPKTTGKFMLWCHDKAGVPNGTSVSTPFETPFHKGIRVRVTFRALYNNNIRIHLQYRAGTGQIEISDVRIYKLV